MTTARRIRSATRLWVEANERLESQPTVNIEGLVGGYTEPGGKAILAAFDTDRPDMGSVSWK